ncbi:MAG: IS5 family transposase [Microthrixaceae bacterium]|nr:IS5 family transposase [Microthrixaceae bacterium]
MIRLVTGASWVNIEAILDHEVSDTTLRERRDEWIRAGVFDRLETEVRAAYDRIIGIDLSEVALDGSIHKAPCGGDGTGPNPTDRAKLGWKWSVAVDAKGVPLGWVTDGANRNDSILLEPTLEAVRVNGYLAEIETLHLDRGYDSKVTRERTAAVGLTDVMIQPRRVPGSGEAKQSMRLGLRWVVEATNSWWSSYGQLRRNTDRFKHHRYTALSLATVILMAGRLIDYHNRWNPK